MRISDWSSDVCSSDLFDYCCCHACFALADAGYETIMINCNPETVSTDYDTSDRLYFEPLTAEDVLEILHVEQSKGEQIGRATSELPSLMRISYAVFCMKTKINYHHQYITSIPY